MRYCVLGLLMLTLSMCAHGQSFDDISVDSLRKLIHSPTTHDTLRIKALAELGHQYISLSPDSALYFLERAYQMASNQGYKLGQASALNYLGRYYSSRDKFFVAMDHFLKALRLPGEYYKHDQVKLITYYDLGQLYAKMAARSPSEELNKNRIAYFHRTLDALKTVKDFNYRDEFFAVVNMELGRAHNRVFPSPIKPYDYQDSAEYYFTRALVGAQEGKINFLVTSILNDLANVAYARKEYRKAIQIQRSAIEKSKPGDSFRGVLYITLARLYMELNLTDSALFYLSVGKKIDPSIVSSGDYYSMVGDIEQRRGNPRKAVAAFEKMLSIAQEQSQITNVEVAANNLSHEYEKIGDYKNALRYERLAQLTDSVYNQDVYLKMQDLQSQADIANQQAQIDLLSRESEIKNLTIEKNRSVQLLIAGMLVLALTGIVIVLIQYRALRKSKIDQAKAFKEVDQMKSQFFANISHEFRTPLTLLLGPLERKLADGTLPAPEKNETLLMHRNASHLLTLVNELLDLSKLEAGTMTLSALRTDLSRVVSIIASQFASVAEGKGVKFTLDLEPLVWGWVDESKFEKVVTNLLSNAFKFSEAGGTVTVSLQQFPQSTEFPNGYIQLQVADTGIGIDQIHQQKIFDRFYQIDSKSTRAFEGTGIGLALTKDLVQLHYGKILVNSEPGRGSTFTVRIPSGADHLKPQELVNAKTHFQPEVSFDHPDVPFDSPNGLSHEKDTVLIVEDNRELRKYIRQQLEKSYSILEAEDGEQGVQIAQQELPGLVITDLMMPRKDGLELCHDLKNHAVTSHIPVILLTARADAESRLEGFRQGADEYIEKPFRQQELMVRIENIIRNRKLLQERFSRQLELKPSSIKVESLDEAFIKKVMAILEQHIDNTEFSVTVFAKEAGMSQAHFFRKLQALTGFTPNDFIRHARLLRAMDLLRQKSGNVADIAYRVGFNNLSYFSKVYKEKFGVSPSDELKSNR